MAQSKKSYKRSYHRRKYYRKKRYNQTVSMRSPVATKMITKMKYFETVSIDPGAAASTAHVFNAVGLFDPNTTGTGHQPRGFDELVGVLYDHFTVIGAKITVRFSNEDNTAGALVGVALRDSATLTTNINDYTEQGYSKFVALGQATGQAQKTVSMRCNPSKFLGISKPLSASQLRGDASTNPSEGAFFHCFVAPQDGVSNISPVHAQVLIEYIVALTEPRVPGQS